MEKCRFGTEPKHTSSRGERARPQINKRARVERASLANGVRLA